MNSIEWLIDQLKDYDFLLSLHQFDIEQAKEMHKQEIIDAWENAPTYLEDKKGEDYYQETFVSKGSDECHFEPTTNTSSATICKHCGREKFLHTT